MDKVASSYFMPTSFSPTSMPANVRGHHSSISKAVNAHRQMVEERTSRQSHRQLDPSSEPSMTFSEDIQMNNIGTEDPVSANDANSYIEREMIDPAGSPAKLAIVQAFQTSEPGRPVVGEPVPKGSYLDVEG